MTTTTHTTADEFAAAAAAGKMPRMPSRLSLDEKRVWCRAATDACRQRDIAIARARRPAKSAEQQAAEDAERARLSAEPEWMKETRAAHRVITATMCRGQEWIDGHFITRSEGGRSWLARLPALGSRRFGTRKAARQWIGDAPAALRLRAEAGGYDW